MAQEGINVKYDPAHKRYTIKYIRNVCFFLLHLTRLSHSNAWPGTASTFNIKKSGRINGLRACTFHDAFLRLI